MAQTLKTEIPLQKTSKIKSKEKKVEYSCRIGNHLHQQLSKHIQKVQTRKASETKQGWIEEAIREKLSMGESSDNLVNNNHLHLKVDVELWSALGSKIQELKTGRISISKKEWIEEAILEKMDREEKKPQELLKSMRDFPSRN